MDEQEINEKISAWIGRKCTCVKSDDMMGGESAYWGGCAMHHLGGLATPYATSDRCAVELLPELIERGYSITLSGHPLETGWVIEITDGANIDFCRHKPTIADTICAGVVQVIENDMKLLR